MEEPGLVDFYMGFLLLGVIMRGAELDKERFDELFELAGLLVEERRMKFH